MPAGGSARVVVIGGGPAGLAAAIALAERGEVVAVVDPGQATPALSRCEMLPEAACTILERLGLKEVLDASVPLDGIVSLWGTAQPIDHGAASLSLSGFGWSVDRRVLDATLRRRAAALGVRICNGRVDRVDGAAGAWRLALGADAPLAARFLVDATGRPAAIARRLGATTRFGPDLVAVTCSMDQPVPANLLAEAQSNGWWYALPRPGGGGSVGFVTASVEGLLTGCGLAEAGRALRLVPRPEGATEIVASDSRMSRLFPTVGPGWLAAGDAAAAFDPVASQGLFNALSGGFFAGNAAADAMSGDPEAAHVYDALVDRTAQRTHRMIPLQYGGQAFDTPFWRQFGRRDAAPLAAWVGR